MGPIVEAWTSPEGVVQGLKQGGWDGGSSATKVTVEVIKDKCFDSFMRLFQ